MSRKAQGWFVAAFAVSMVGWTFAIHKFVVSTDTYAPPPSHIRFCGIEDKPCEEYTVTFRYREINGFELDGVTNCEDRTITVYRHVPLDRFYDVSTLKHEAYHALLCEHGFTNEEQDEADIAPVSAHEWIYRVESWDTMMLHDNPEFVAFVERGY